MVSCNGMARKAIANAPGVPSGLDRPMPPGEMWEEEATGRFVPAPEVVDWIRRAILDERGPIHNPDHVHLRMARIGVLWTDLPARRQMRAIVGQAEMPQPRGSAWARARQEQQLREWFGGGVDFLITLYAPHAAAIDDASWCALVEHELYHCCTYTQDLRKRRARHQEYGTEGQPSGATDDPILVTHAAGYQIYTALPLLPPQHGRRRCP